MKADLSRNTFNRAQHYSSVRLQQGRIVTDADWNEQADLTRYRDERQALDTIGRCAAPVAAAGYRLVAQTNAIAVQAVNANVAWIAAEDGALLRTTNGGADWVLIDLGTTANVRALAQVGGTGWAVGDGGIVRKTSTQGASWIPQSPGTLDTLRGVSVFDSDHVWAVGDNGTMVASADGGASWSLTKASATRLYAVHFVDELAGIAVGQDGVIVTSPDGGQSWTAATSGTTAHLRSLAVFGTTLAWAAGQGGTIVRSEDAGATWEPCNTPTTATLYAIGFRDQNEGWAAGDGGVVLHTSDGGANWSLENVGTQVTLRGLSFFGSDPGWLVGDASTALRVGGGSPDTTDIVLPAVNLTIEPGRCYVNGTLCELESPVSFAHQVDGGADERLAPGGYLMYLDVWQYHVSYLQAPAIREVALGGPDTATRARTVAQVRALPLLPSSPFDWSCGSHVTAWDALINAQAPLLAARSEPQLAATSVCDIAATAGYQRLENQLYRVEIHAGGTNPTFKWSRENGSVVYGVVSVNVDNTNKQTVVKLTARGRDANLDLTVGDRVELIDDDADLVDRAGVLFEYLNDGNDELEIVLSGVPVSTLGQDATLHPVLRRWDHRPDVPGTNALPLVTGRWLDLEDGVQIFFNPGGEYRPGDYWQIPARTITADVEWPLDDDGDPIPRPPAGIADAYCRLGIIEVGSDGSVSVISDCRTLFPPLTAMEQLLYVSGDGQDAAPNALLPQPLTVRVARGELPLKGRGIRFEVDSGAGTVEGGVVFDTVTDEDGQAVCQWRLGPGVLAPNRFQRVRATLLDCTGVPVPGQLVIFCATASLSLRYVSGDGQDALPGATLPFPLEVQVVNGADGISGVSVQATIERGNGSVSPATVASGPQGEAAFQWQLGEDGGPQRVRVELLDSAGQVIQRSSFAATATTTGTTKCEVSIGPGGDFPVLTSALLRQLLEQGKGSACICFLPGTHEVPGLVSNGANQSRLSLHGCGQTSQLVLGGPLALSEFVALEIRDLVLREGNEANVVLTNNLQIQLTDVQFVRQDAVKSAALNVSGARSVAMTRCDVLTTMPAMAALFQGITGPCQITGNHFLGQVSFYGESNGVPTLDQLERLAARKSPQLIPNASQLCFTNNSLSQLTIASALIEQLAANGVAAGLFASAFLTGNTLTEDSNVFVAGLMGCNLNAFLAQPTNNPFHGVMMATRATATGNLALPTVPTEVSNGAQLRFVVSDTAGVQKAANATIVTP